MFYNPNPTNLELDETESRHCAKVMRKKIGDSIVLFDGQGLEFNCILTSVGKKCTYKIESKTIHPKPNQFLNIAIAPPKKAARLDFMIEKLVEIGVNQIFLLSTDNSERTRVNAERLEKQIVTACKQSKQFYVPKIFIDINLKVLVQKSTSLLVCHCYQNLERKPFGSIVKSNLPDSIWCIGPEGDFTQKEIEFLESKGATSVNLGKMRLRTETAAIYIACNHHSVKS